MSFAASALNSTIAGRFARDALAMGEGEVCAAFQRSCYLRFAGERYACVGDASLGCGPLNALVTGFSPPAIGARLSVAVAQVWSPPRLPVMFRSLERTQVPEEGLGCLLVGERNALAAHAVKALQGLEGWLRNGAGVPPDVAGL